MGSTGTKRQVRGDCIEMQPQKALRPGLTYRLYLPPEAVKDAAGSSLAEELWLEFAVSAGAR